MDEDLRLVVVELVRLYLRDPEPADVDLDRLIERPAAELQSILRGVAVLAAQTLTLVGLDETVLDMLAMQYLSDDLD